MWRGGGAGGGVCKQRTNCKNKISFEARHFKFNMLRVEGERCGCGEWECVHSDREKNAISTVLKPGTSNLIQI
jgi:hypothetical protein